MEEANSFAWEKPSQAETEPKGFFYSIAQIGFLSLIGLFRLLFPVLWKNRFVWVKLYLRILQYLFLFLFMFAFDLLVVSTTSLEKFEFVVGWAHRRLEKKRIQPKQISVRSFVRPGKGARHPHRSQSVDLLVIFLNSRRTWRILEDGR